MPDLHFPLVSDLKKSDKRRIFRQPDFQVPSFLVDGTVFQFKRLYESGDISAYFQLIDIPFFFLEFLKFAAYSELPIGEDLYILAYLLDIL